MCTNRALNASYLLKSLEPYLKFNATLIIKKICVLYCSSRHYYVDINANFNIV